MNGCVVTFFIILSALSPYFFYPCSSLKVIVSGVLLGALGVGVFFLTIGQGYLVQGGEALHRALLDSMAYYKGQGLSEEKLTLLREMLGWFRQMVVQIFPALLVVIVTILVTFNYFLARYFLKKMGKGLPPVRPLTHWKIPDGFIWIFILASFCVWIGKTVSPGPLYRLGLNFIFLMLTAYLGQGFILTRFFLKKWQWPLVLQIVLYLIFLFQPVVLLMIMLWGIFEVWFDFRKLGGAKV